MAAFGVFVVLTWLKLANASAYGQRLRRICRLDWLELANAFGVTVLEIRRDWVFLSSDDPHQ